MEIKEAIQRIDEHKRIHFKREPFAVYITEALEMAKLALEKRISMIPTKIYIDDTPPHWQYVCCKCGNAVLKSQKYCCTCGQALDWHIERNEVK